MGNSTQLKNLIHEIKVFADSSHWLTPVNLMDERQKFLSNPANSPNFIYPDYPKEKIREMLHRLQDGGRAETKSLEDYLLNRTKEELELKLQLLLERGTEKIRTISQELYLCNFPDEIVNQAKIDGAINELFGTKETASAADAVTVIQKYLFQNKVFDWKVEESDASDFYVRVKAEKKLILISKHIIWDFSDLDNTIAHEIDGHVFRGINASRQDNPLLQKPFPFYIKTEEGLASYLADFFSTTALISRKHHALKYLAGYLGLTSTFKQIFEFLTDSGFTKELAFQRTFRLKRGYEDTSIPGIFAREAMYYEGMIEVKNYLENGGDLTKLYSCKCGLGDVDYVTAPIEQILPKRLG